MFAVDTEKNENVVFCLRQYEPFVTDPTEDTVFRLKICAEPLDTDGFEQEMKQQEEGQDIVAGHIGDRPCFQFWLFKQLKAVLVCSSDYRQGKVYAENDNLFGINNALMAMYAAVPAGEGAMPYATAGARMNLEKVTDEEMEGWKRDYPEAFARKIDPAAGVCLEGWLIPDGADGA